VSLATLIADAVGLRKHRGPIAVGRRGGFPDVAKAPPDTRRLIRDRRYCHVLSTELSLDDVSVSFAWKAVEYDMALVPGGGIRLVNDAAFTTASGFVFEPIPGELIQVEPLYIDRDCVTNSQYAKFAQSDGYSNPHYWPEEVLPSVLQFTDQTGLPAPKDWTDGNPPPDKLDHPVVGICWYEANAYATWVGKRLPSTEEWQRAATWAKAQSGDGTEQRYPWGNAFDPVKTNTWASGLRDTVAIDSYPAGATPNGVRHLIGNVWEWVDAQFYPNAESGVSVMLEETMAEIRGGAFDTYFPSQSTCQFRTGQPLSYRGSNVGFRCCIGFNALPPPPDSQDLLPYTD
jgi:iron(II)-dependent oxidoreductase